MNNIPSVFWLIPIASVVALGMAWFFFRSMMKEDEGTDRMKEIAAHVRKGAMAYLKQQYKVVAIVFVVLAVIFAFMAYVMKVQNPWVPFAFLTGGFFCCIMEYTGEQFHNSEVGLSDIGSQRDKIFTVDWISLDKRRKRYYEDSIFTARYNRKRN